MIQTYFLPTPIAAAVRTNRAEFVDVYLDEMETRIENGDDVDREKLEMARLIGDLLRDRADIQYRSHGIAERLRSVAGVIGSASDFADGLLAAAMGIENHSESGAANNGNR